MALDLYTPCSECPFLMEGKDRVRHLGADRILEIQTQLESGNHFECHRTCDYKDGEVRSTQKSKICAGANILMEKEYGGDGPGCEMSQMVRIAVRVSGFDPRKLDMEAPVFDSWDEMAEAHER